MKKKAFTLVETMIVIAFSIAVMLAITLLIYNFNKISFYDQTSSKSSSSARALLREIESLTAQAKDVISTHTFSGTARASSSTVLVLEIPSIDSSGNVIANTYDYAAFYATGTNAYRVLEANVASNRVSGTKQLSSTLSVLTFSYNNTNFPMVNIVTVDIQTRATAKQEIISDHLHEQIRLRNH